MAVDHKEALQHALDALGDGSGHQDWGPGPILERLDAISNPAAEALAIATQVAVKVGHRTRAKMTATIRRVAPVVLDVIWGDDG
jgi:hypothetical protein